jgi:hypothetical protein
MRPGENNLEKIMESEKAIMDVAMMLCIGIWDAEATEAFHTLPRNEQVKILRSPIMHAGIMLRLKEALGKKAEEIQQEEGI